MNRECSTCCFGDVCPEKIVCEDYSPITPELSDEMLFETIENNRQLYRKAWMEYINEDDFLFD